LLALLACLGTVALAQLDPGVSAVYQNGAKVGEIYVPARTDQGLYAEHWILYPNYAYVGQGGAEIKIVPDPNKNYASEADFFARAPFGPGYRYVHVTSEDSAKLPRP
jgi:hypothetical protein